MLSDRLVSSMPVIKAVLILKQKFFYNNSVYKAMNHVITNKTISCIAYSLSKELIRENEDRDCASILIIQQ